MDINRVTLLGRLAGDVKVWKTPSGVKVARFTVALNRQYKNPETHSLVKKVSWVPVAVWGSRVGPCQEYLGKGSLVFIEGHIETSSWTDKEGKKHASMHVTANNVKFLSGKKEKEKEKEKKKEKQT